MADVRAFRGVRYSPAVVGSDVSALVCPPFDVISPDEQAALYARHPRNFVHLELARGEGEVRYAQAAADYAAWMAEGTLVQDPAPALYAERVSFTFDQHRYIRKGVVVALRLEPWETGQVRPHERTFAGPKQDRIKLMRACGANFSPIWVLSVGRVEALQRLWGEIEDRVPDATARDADGATHELWACTDSDLALRVHQDFLGNPVYIADGHHRYETALAYREEALEQNGGEDASANFVMAYLVEGSDPGLTILGGHRLVRPPAGFHAEDLRRGLGDAFEFQERSGSASEILAEVGLPRERPAFGVWSPSLGLTGIARLRGRGVPADLAGDHSEAWRSLDASALQLLCLDRLFGSSADDLVRAGVLSYAYGIADALAVVASGQATIAFLLTGTPSGAIFAVADAADRMPEKSTFFYPKPLTGMVMASLRGSVPSPDGETVTRL